MMAPLFDQQVLIYLKWVSTMGFIETRQITFVVIIHERL